jgi:hypothetical protein
MNRIQHIRRVAGVLAGLACALLGFAATGPAAFAGIPVPGPGGAAGDPPPVFPAPIRTVTVVAGGMPGWQIILIAVGAALLAATVAVLVDRTRTAHRKTIRAAV